MSDDDRIYGGQGHEPDDVRDAAHGCVMAVLWLALALFGIAAVLSIRFAAGRVGL